jgi:hypothetical protein
MSKYFLAEMEFHNIDPWNSGKVPRMKVIVEMMTTLRDVKAMA